MKLTSSPRNTVLIVGAFACLGGYLLDHKVKQVVDTHVIVKGGTPAVIPPQLDSLRQLYPLLATPQQQPAVPAENAVPGAVQAPQSLDQLFGKVAKPKGDSKAKAPEVVDYFAALNQSKAKNVRLDGLAPGVGAVINGAFIAIGEPIPSLEYPSDTDQKKMLIPRLSTVAPAGITIREPNGSRSIVVTITQ